MLQVTSSSCPRGSSSHWVRFQTCSLQLMDSHQVTYVPKALESPRFACSFVIEMIDELMPRGINVVQNCHPSKCWKQLKPLADLLDLLPTGILYLMPLAYYASFVPNSWTVVHTQMDSRKTGKLVVWLCRCGWVLWVKQEQEIIVKTCRTEAKTENLIRQTTSDGIYCIVWLYNETGVRE